MVQKRFLLQFYQLYKRRCFSSLSPPFQPTFCCVPAMTILGYLLQWHHTKPRAEKKNCLRPELFASRACLVYSICWPHTLKSWPHLIWASTFVTVYIFFFQHPLSSIFPNENSASSLFGIHHSSSHYSKSSFHSKHKTKDTSSSFTTNGNN